MTDERATVATVQVEVKGLRELLEQGLQDIQRQLGRLENIPERVSELHSGLTVLERRVDSEVVRLDRRIEDRGSLILQRVEGADKRIDKLEGEQTSKSSRVVQWVSVAVVAVVGAVSVVFYVLTLAGSPHG